MMMMMMMMIIVSPVKKILQLRTISIPFCFRTRSSASEKKTTNPICLRLRSTHLLLPKEERETGQDGTDLVRFRLWQCLPAGCCQGRRISETEVSLATARIREHRFGLQGSVRPLSHPFQDLLRSLGQAVVLTFTPPRFSFFFSRYLLSAEERVATRSTLRVIAFSSRMARVLETNERTTKAFLTSLSKPSASRRQENLTAMSKSKSGVPEFVLPGSTLPRPMWISISFRCSCPHR
jgi:hypothetical protein